MWFRTTSPSDTQAFAAALARVIRSGDTIVLTGEMGAGKTVVAQGIGAAMGVPEPMTSPTFTLVNTSLTLVLSDKRAQASVFI